jgi:glycosyltransferase involved in cell wall biosynthesis
MSTGPSEVCLVTLRKADVNNVVIPVRMLEFVSWARPVVLCAEGQASQILNAANAGLVIEQGNNEALTAAIVRLSRDADLRQRMGANGRRYVIENFSREQTARLYLEVLEQASSNCTKVKGQSQ